MRLCSGHPKIHFGTIVEGSWKGGGGGGGGTVGPPGSLTKCTSFTIVECTDIYFYSSVSKGVSSPATKY